MSLLVLRLSALFYAGAVAAYVVYFARPRHATLATVGQWLLGIAFLVQAGAIGLGCKEYGGAEFFGLRGGLVVMTWLGAGASLVVQRLYRIPAIGAFITPLVLVVLLPTLFLVKPDFPEVLPEAVRRPMLTVHIVTALLGVSLFAIASLVAVMYLLQEREVKGKRFGALFSRLPSLAALDQVNQRVVRFGFVVFTVALLTGSGMAKVVWKSAWQWDPQQVSSLVIWLIYGAMVQLRHTGWHGRRFALLTIAAFALVVGSMTLLNVLPPGMTRHGGDFSGDLR
jgi:ABC-type transport system involved in cytochrome c biogenesis permease subunit